MIAAYFKERFTGKKTGEIRHYIAVDSEWINSETESYGIQILLLSVSIRVSASYPHNSYTPTGSDSRKQYVSLVMKHSRHPNASVGIAASYFSSINCQAVSSEIFKIMAWNWDFVLSPQVCDILKWIRESLGTNIVAREAVELRVDVVNLRHAAGPTLFLADSISKYSLISGNIDIITSICGHINRKVMVRG